MFLGILPPFHSFGFSVAGLLPILSGIKIAFYPDPTDSYAVAYSIDKWKVTLVCTAPSFLRGILQAGSVEQLESLRLIITGAERTPKEVIDKVKALGDDKKLIEGYGITECAPMISMNLTPGTDTGVGKPLDGIEICTINPETNELLEKGKEGEICVKGDNVFKGYVVAEKEPFIEINNQRWYRSGDLGYLNDDGNLILSGRIKRFTKVAGEMVSLGGVEHVISDELHRIISD